MAEKLTEKTINNAIAYYEDLIVGLKRFDGRFRTRQESRARKRLKRLFDRQMQWIIRNMEELSQFIEPQESSVVRIERKRFDAEIGELVDELPFDNQIAEVVVTAAGASYKKGARRTYNQFRLGTFGIAFDLVNQDAVAYLAAKRSLHLSNNKGSIARTTKRRIIKILTDAAQTGKSYNETAKLIQAQGKAGVFSRARGKLIAVREVGLAYGEGNLAPVRRLSSETGAIVQKQWITSGDDRVTDECAANEAQGWIDLEAFFDNTGAQEVAPRSDHPRCRCDTGYRVVDTEGNPV